MIHFAKYTISYRKFFLLLAGLLVAAWLGWLSWHAIQLLRLASRAAGYLNSGIEALQPLEVGEMLHDASRHLNALDSGLRPVYPLARLVGALPGIGPYASQFQPLVSLAANLAHAGDLIVAPLLPVLGEEEPGGQSITSRLFLGLQAGGENFNLAQDYLNTADQARTKIRPELLPERLQPAFQKLNEYFPNLKSAAVLLPLLPGLMGEDQPQTYLLLAQNRDELRASGGFITGIGVVRLQQGEILEFQIGDSYSVDDFSKPYPLPPEPLQRWMLAGVWVARDANWSPDFPSAAQQVQELYRLSTDNDTQGVMAFDQDFISALLGVLGPLNLPNMTTPVDAGNVENYMQQSWAPEPGEGLSEDWWLQRKDFMGQLGRALLEQAMQTRQVGKLLDLAKIALEQIQTGHLLIYFNNQQAQQFLAQAGVDHHLGNEPGDFLMLVDSNLGFNKADAVVQRSVTYEVDLTDPLHPLGKLTLHYQHTGNKPVDCVHIPSYGEGTYSDMQQRCYWDYWRVLTPAGTTLSSYQVQPIPGEQLLNQQPWPGEVEKYAGEAGKQVFAGLLVLEPGSTQEIPLTLALPANILQEGQPGGLVYQLNVRKQPGLENLPLQITVHAPSGFHLAESNEPWQQQSAQTWSLDKYVESGLLLTLNFIPDQP